MFTQRDAEPRKEDADMQDGGAPRSRKGPAKGVVVDPELVAKAQAAGVDVRVEIETAVKIVIARQRRWQAWREENRAARRATPNSSGMVRGTSRTGSGHEAI